MWRRRIRSQLIVQVVGTQVRDLAGEGVVVDVKDQAEVGKTVCQKG